MLKSTKHIDIIEALEWCVARQVGLLCKTPREWIDWMGYKTYSSNLYNLAVLNVAQAGKKQNEIKGYDWIGDNFPYWSRQKKYQPFTTRI